jgi:hypothetical protein
VTGNCFQCNTVAIAYDSDIVSGMDREDLLEDNEFDSDGVILVVDLVDVRRRLLEEDHAHNTKNVLLREEKKEDEEKEALALETMNGAKQQSGSVKGGSQRPKTNRVLKEPKKKRGKKEASKKKKKNSKSPAPSARPSTAPSSTPSIYVAAPSSTPSIYVVDCACPFTTDEVGFYEFSQAPSGSPTITTAPTTTAPTTTAPTKSKRSKKKKSKKKKSKKNKGGKGGGKKNKRTRTV